MVSIDSGGRMPAAEGAFRFRRVEGGAGFDPIPVLVAMALAALHFVVHRGSYPEHDTYYVFQAFKTVYESILSGHGVPTWLPEVQYGAPAHVYLFPALTPWQYLLARIGGGIGWTEGALTLFHLSVAGEMATFLIGCALLAGRVCEHRAAAVSLVIIAGLTTIVHLQVWFNLRIVAGFPFIAYFLIRFVEDRRPRWFLAATLAAMIWLLGNIFYFLPIALLVLAALLSLIAGPALRTPGDIRWRDLLGPVAGTLLAANVAFAFCLIGVAADIFDGVALRSPFREADGVTDLLTFMTYGGNVDLRKLVELLLALPHNPDSLLYFGAVPLALALYAPLGGGWRRARPYVIIGGLFIAFALPGLVPVARFLYDLVPGMHYFRHIGLIAGLAKLCFLIVAAIGADTLLTNARRSGGVDVAPLSWIVWVVAVLAVVAILVLGRGYTLYPFQRMFPDYPAAFGSVLQIAAVPVTALVLFGLALAAAARGGPDIGRVLVALAVLEGGAYAHFHYWANESRNPAAIAASFHAEADSYHPRLFPTPAPEDAGLIAFYDQPSPGYYPLEAMLSRPPCVETGRRDARAVGVADMIVARRGVPTRPGEQPQPRSDDAALLKVLGCDAPRLRLTNQVFLLSDTAAARAFVGGAPEFGRFAGLTCPLAEGGDCRALPPWRPIDREITPDAFTGDRLSVRVVVDAPGGAWLVYADGWAPGWRATVDGEPSPVRPADLGLKAVFVPAGERSVELVYRPSAMLIDGYHALMWIALAALALGGALVWNAVWDGIERPPHDRWRYGWRRRRVSARAGG